MKQEGNTLALKVLRQKIVVSGQTYDLQEIYGLSEIGSPWAQGVLIARGTWVLPK